MSWAHLVWSGIWRRPGRTILTLLSIVTAFQLFALLQGLSSGIGRAADQSSADVLMTFSRVSQIEPLPMGHAAQIATVPGIAAITPTVIFTGTYQRPLQYVPAVAVDVDRYLSVYPKIHAAQAAVEAMRQVRNGALVGPLLAQRYGWKVGDTVPLRSVLWLNRDGSPVWPVKIVGILSGERGPGMMVNYAFVDEARSQSRGTASFFLLKTSDPRRASQIAQAVDNLFANSPHETKTVTPRALAQSQLKQIGDIQLVVNSIVGAVFFALLFSVGAVLGQGIRERIPELAVMKAMGFSDSAMLGLVLTETLVFCLLSAGIGLSTGVMFFPLVRQFVGFNAAAGPVLVTGLGFAVAMAVVCGLPPALRANRLQVVDALAGR